MSDPFELPLFLEDQPLHGRIRGVGTAVRTAARFTQSSKTEPVVPFDVLVPGLSAYAEVLAKVCYMKTPGLGQRHESELLFHRVHFFPGHDARLCVTYVPGLSVTDVPGSYLV